MFAQVRQDSPDIDNAALAEEHYPFVRIMRPLMRSILKRPTFLQPNMLVKAFCFVKRLT